MIILGWRMTSAARWRVSVSAFLGNLFLLFLQLHPLEVLNINLLPRIFTLLVCQLSQDANATEKQLLIWLLILPDNLLCYMGQHGSTKPAEKTKKPTGQRSPTKAAIRIYSMGKHGKMSLSAQCTKQESKFGFAHGSKR